jgi:hypothetical protein
MGSKASYYNLELSTLRYTDHHLVSGEEGWETYLRRGNPLWSKRHKCLGPERWIREGEVEGEVPGEEEGWRRMWIVGI